jgi:hypothetical protein
MAATLLKVNLRVPESLYPIVSTFLLLGIGLKGGRELSEISIDSFWKPLVIVLFLGLINPLLAFSLFRLFTRLDEVNSAALAAHYGSPSLVTFIVLLTTLDTRGIKYGGYAAALFACLEIVGIVVALSMSKKITKDLRRKSLILETLRSPSIALIAIGILIGMIVGNARMVPTDSFFIDLVPGVLTLFLIEMGIIAAKHFADFRSIGFKLIFLAIAIPLINGVIGVLLAVLGGMSEGDVIVLGTLAGSASFVAAPAVVRVALPKASPSLYLTTSIGITFPFLITLGIPMLIKVSELLS